MVDGAVRQSAHVAAVTVRDIQVGGSAARAQEDDPPVARHGRRRVPRRVPRQIGLPACEVDRDDVDVELLARGMADVGGGDQGERDHEKEQVRHAPTEGE